MSSPSMQVPGRPIVLKIGGSLATGPRLLRVLDVAAGSKRRIAIVPGGGEFADLVRKSQAQYRFDDRAAHRMAILGMHQTGLMFEALQPRLVAVETLSAMRGAWSRGRMPVWLPLKLTDRDRTIPASWDATSDGLAARLAQRLKADRVILLKSCPIDREAGVRDLVRKGIVDPVFARIVEGHAMNWCALGPGEETLLEEALGTDEAGGDVVAAAAQGSSHRRRARGVVRPR